MVNISRKIYKRNGIKTIVVNDGVLRLNEKLRQNCRQNYNKISFIS